MTAANGFGLFAQGVLAASALLAAASRFFRPRLAPGSLPAAAIWGAIVALSVAVRVDGLPLAAHLRGLVGDPSIVSFVLLVLAALRPGMLPAAPASGTAAAIAGAFSLFFYLPLVTGVFPLGLDVYALGWRPAPLLAALGALGALLWLRGGNRWVAVLSVTVLAWGVGLVESDNLLDALIDPGLVLACAACAIRRPPLAPASARLAVP